MDDLDRLLSLEAIRGLALRYALAADGKDLDAMAALFVPDVDNGRYGRGRDGVKRFYDQSLRRFHCSVHLVANHVVDLDGDDQATGVVYCQARHHVLKPEEHWFDEALAYFDAYERVEGAWLFRRRRLRSWYRQETFHRVVPEIEGSGPKRGGRMPEAFPMFEPFWGATELMEIGIRIPHTGRRASPEVVRSWCMAADRLGFDSLWGVDHVVMPQRVQSKYVLPRTPASIADDAVSALLSPNFELMTTLAFVAAVTERIRLGTAVAVLPIRNAVLNARQLATVDRYSGGRLLYGVGVGWLQEEAAAMGMPWDRRGARSDEHIALLRAIWTAPGPHVEFHGEFHDVPPMDPEPRPVQQPIPVLVGGHSAVAIDRAARLGDGWIAANMSSDRIGELLPVLHTALDRHGRDATSVPVYCGAGPDDATLDGLRQYRDLGVHSVLVALDTLDDLERFAAEVLPGVR